MSEEVREVEVPVRLTTFDHFGIQPPAADATKAEKFLSTVYGVAQIVLTGIPELKTSGHAEAAVASLLRDATISMAACITTSRHGLYEPTVGIARGILEARLYVLRIRKSVVPDQTAALHAVDCLLGRKQQLEGQIAIGVRAANDRFARTQLLELKNALKSPALALAVQELTQLRSQNRRWYGATSLKELAEDLSDDESYHLVYVPASAFYVHPGDPDVHLLERDGDVVVRPLSEQGSSRLDAARAMAAQEGFQLLVNATKKWKLGSEIRVVIDQLLPLMNIAMAKSSLDGQEFADLEAQCGFPREQWHDLVSVKFDWDGT